MTNQDFRLPSSETTPRVTYPLGVLDAVGANSAHILVVLMRFNDVLDAQKLHSSLNQLLIIGDWAKLAGRFIRDPITKKPVLQVPQNHGSIPSYQAIDFNHTTHSTTITSHSLGSQLPTTHNNNQIALEPSTAKFSPFFYPAHRASQGKSLTTLIENQLPPLSMQITSFTDATLIGISFPHAILDAMAFQSLLKNWCLVLADKHSQVQPVSCPFEDVPAPLWDPLLREQRMRDIKDTKARGNSFGKDDEDKTRVMVHEIPPEEEFAMAPFVLTGWKFLVVALRFCWTTFVRQKVVGSTNIVLLAGYMAELRVEAEKSLPPGVEFVSDGDIICAWFTKVMADTHDWKGPLTQINVIDMRSRIPALLDPEGVYLANVSSGAVTLFENEDVRGRDKDSRGRKGMGLGGVAAKIRAGWQAQSTPAQVMALWRLAWPTPDKVGGMAPLIGTGVEMNVAVVSNWAKAKFMLDTDFGPAVIRAGRADEERTNASGRMQYMITRKVVQDPTTRNCAVIIGKDCEGNYWLNVVLAEKKLKQFEQVLQEAEARRKR